ncbi:MAG: hypothetical protein HRU69_01665 [Flammeovirgaceae bacterium]|nr:MAG: hypothetical protein HRU69_01665 [Flammeovirgaceae bacterium]
MFKPSAILIALVFIGSCNTSQVSSASITAVGLLFKPEFTSYMYGTHALEESRKNKHYALTSSTCNLDNYVNKTVRVRGKRIQGYSLSGGPQLIEVISVEIIKPQ